MDFINDLKESLNFTNGSIPKKLVSFVIPVLLGNILQQLYITADAIIVGRYIGKLGLASIDAVHNLLRLPIVFFIGLSTGASIIISQYYGAKSRKDQFKATHTAIALSILGGVILSIVGIILTPIFLSFLSIPDDIYDSSLKYVRIYFSGISFIIIYNIGAGILRAVGNSKTPFYILIISCIINIFLDILFVGYFNLNVSGAAFATCIVQVFGAIMVLFKLKNSRTDSKLYLRKIKFHKNILKSIFVLGLPIAIQSIFYPIANMMMQSSINNTGTDNIAAWALCGKLDFLIWISIESMVSAISTFSAQNYGAKQIYRIKKGVNICLLITIFIVAIFSLILYFYSENLSKLFINENDYIVVEITVSIMRFISPFYIFFVFGDIFSGSIIGTGETFRPLIITLFSISGTRMFWVLFVIQGDKDLIKIILGYPTSWIINSVFFTIYYTIYKRKVLE